MDAILGWPWKLFCAKWARLIALVAREKDAEHERQQEQTFAELRRKHDERMGMG